MAEHVSTTFHGPETQEALLAERQQFWNGFTNVTVGMIIFLVLLLIGMAVFLL